MSLTLLVVQKVCLIVCFVISVCVLHHQCACACLLTSSVCVHTASEVCVCVLHCQCLFVYYINQRCVSVCYVISVCLLLFYATETVFQLCRDGDMKYEMRRRKPEPALLQTQGIINLLHHIDVA